MVTGQYYQQIDLFHCKHIYLSAACKEHVTQQTKTLVGLLEKSR